MYSYNKKMEILPNLVRVYDYDVPIIKEFETTRTDYSKRKKGEKSEPSLHRTRNIMKNLVDCNVTKYSKFITFTFAKDIKDYDLALHCWRCFLRRFERHYGVKMKYVAVMELQNGSERHGKTKEEARNVWHFHAVVFFDKKLDYLEFEKKVWKYGSTNIKLVDSTDNLGRYLMKYITKDMVEINLNKKVILHSRYLKTPYVATFNLEEDSIKDYRFIRDLTMGDMTYEKIFSYERPEYINKKNNLLVPSTQVNCRLREYKRIKNAK